MIPACVGLVIALIVVGPNRLLGYKPGRAKVRQEQPVKKPEVLNELNYVPSKDDVRNIIIYQGRKPVLEHRDGKNFPIGDGTGWL